MEASGIEAERRCSFSPIVLPIIDCQLFSQQLMQLGCNMRYVLSESISSRLPARPKPLAKEEIVGGVIHALPLPTACFSALQQQETAVAAPGGPTGTHVSSRHDNSLGRRNGGGPSGLPRCWNICSFLVWVWGEQKYGCAPSP